MTTTPHRTHRRPRVVTGLLAGSLLAGSLVVGAAGTGPAAAADPPEYQNVRLCDPTGCLFAWHVVDSDDDGVSDADELMAGTDPHDPLSKPSLQIVAEVAIKRQLPSFEAGLSIFVILPADIHTHAGDLTKNPLEAFPLGERKSTLERLGISADKLKEMGIDPTRSGMTLGLNHPSKEGGPAAVRVGGMDVRLISEGDPFNGINVRLNQDKWNQKHGPATSTEPVGGTQIVEHYGDGSRIVATYDDEGWKSTEYIDENNKQVTEAHRMEPEHETVPQHDPPPEHAPPTTDGESKDHGDKGSTKPPKKSPNVAYIDTDADTNVVTPEQVELALRSLGSVVLTVQNWEGLETDPSTLKRPGTTILVDPEQAGTYGILFDAPRVTTAQPEYGNGLPSPLEAAPPTKSGGQCEGLCA